MQLRFHPHLTVLLVYFICCHLLTDNLNAQDNRTCLTVEKNHQLQEKFPKIFESTEIFEEWISKKIRDKKSEGNKAFPSIRTIPMIFHVIHDVSEPIGTGSNISADQIQSQVDVLNEDFRRIGNGFNTHPDGIDTEIEFCLALVDENGNKLEEPGIMRWSNWGNGPFSNLESTIKPATSQDPSRFLNYWAASLSDGALGYAQFPSSSGLDGLDNDEGPANTDGVVIIPNATGRVGNLLPRFNLGRTATHEIGHFLGLRHIWGDNSGFFGCFADDYCSDTPNCNYPNFSSAPECPGSNQCSNSCMIENYMDYSDDGCMNIFTSDQKDRIDAVLLNSPNRPFSTSAPTVCQPLPTLANIKNNPSSIRACSPASIQLVNDPSEIPDDHVWVFSGAGVSPSSSMQASPTINLNSTGFLSTNLTASNSYYHESDAHEMVIIILSGSDPICLVPSCTDGVLNGDETEIDCGGSCPLSCNSLCDNYIIYSGTINVPDYSQAATAIEAGNIGGLGNLILSDPTDLTFRAAESVTLAAGFEIALGTSLLTEIGECNGN